MLFALTGLFSFRDFGIPYDEGTLSQLGMESYQYVFEGAEYPADPHFRYHGTAVELPIQIAGKIFGITNDVTMAGFRRFVVFSFFFLAVASFFVLAKKLFGDWKLALIGSVLFVLSPRVFAHGFYNSRDIPTMAMFTLAGVTLLRLLEKKTILRAVVHGLVCGYALGIRMPSLFLVGLTGLFLLIDLWRSNTLKQTIIVSGAFLLATAFTTYLVWPLLWANPIGHFRDALSFMSDLGGQGIPFLGVTYETLPWRYIPGWIVLTTPLLYSILFIVGVIISIIDAIQSRGRTLVTPRTLLPLVWFFLPIAILVLGKSVIYQEWRHVLFLYPAFLLLVLTGLAAILNRISTLQSRPLALAWLVLLVVPVASTTVWMLRNHPHHTVYYAVPRSWISDALDLDYWGLSSKQAVAWIDTHDDRALVTYGSDQNIVLLNGRVFFTPGGKMRLVPVTNASVADYLITVHQPGVENPYENQEELYAITIDGMKIASVYEGLPEARSYMDELRKDPERIRTLLEQK